MEDSPNSFNKLNKIQKLLKEETSIRKLFTQTKKEVVDIINKKTKELYEEKIKVIEYSENYKKLDTHKFTYILNVNPNQCLDQAYDVVSNLLNILQERPDFVFKILKYSSKVSNQNDVKEKDLAKENFRILSSFFIERFYENILTPNSVDNALLIIYYLFYQREINSFRHRKDIYDFLVNNFLNYNLSTCLVRNQIDICNFFSPISKSITEKLEIESNEIFEFNLEKLYKIVHSNNNANILRKSRNSSIGENKEYFCSNYSRKELMQLSLSMKSTNEKMNEYLDSQLFSIVNDEEGYSCYKFLYMVSQMEDASFIMEKYKKYYIICKDIICDILNLLKEKIKTVPYYIKGLCKIIDLLAQKKFGDLKCYEKNIAISNLFLGILLKPFFLNLDFNTLINSWTVSAVVKKNLDTIYHIFKRIISGKLYMSSNPNEVYYTPFNGLTIDLMPEILSIFENLTDVQLPDIIMKLINGNISNESFLYDYFKENLEIGIKQNSFCITYDEIIRIIKIIKKFHPVFIQCEDKLNTSFSSMMTMSADNKSFNSETEKSDNHFAKLYERMTNDEILSYLQTKSAKEKGKKIKTFILFQKTLFNNHLDTLNNINMKNSVYTIKPIKDKEYSENEKNLIKTKNFICKILYYFQELKYSAFPFLKDLNTINILEALNPYLKSEYYILSADLPLDWYGNSLKSCIQLIPQEYIANDYSLLYNELINEISDAISIMKLSDLAEIDHSLNYIQRDINKTKIYIKHLKSLNIYNKIKSFIENAEIFVVIYNDINDKRFFSVEEKEKKSDFLKLFASKKEKEIKNIEEFITSFPEFNKLYKEKKIEVDYYEYINKFNVKPAIIDYYKIVEKYININEEFALVLKADKKNAESYIYSEVHKYIMNRIYDKLYIKYNKDEELNQTCISLKWVQAIHIISNPNIVLDNFLPNVTKLLQLVDKKKSPIEKFNILNNVAKLIQDTIVFSTGKTDNSIDDTTPFLLYALIHGNPANFYSNLRYIEEFLDDSMTMDNQGLILMQYTSTVELLLKFSYDKLYNISEEEYIANCEKCYQNHLDKI